MRELRREGREIRTEGRERGAGHTRSHRHKLRRILKNKAIKEMRQQRYSVIIFHALYNSLSTHRSEDSEGVKENDTAVMRSVW